MTLLSDIQYKVGELAELTNKSVRALRLYEERGLLTPQQRSEGGFRLYGPFEVERVKLIDTLQSVGMSLGEISGLLELYKGAPDRRTGVTELRKQYQVKLELVNAQIERLKTVRSQLEAGSEFLDGCVSCAEIDDPCACRECDRLNDHESDLLMVTGVTV